jgi:hypothetical protein
LAAIGGVWQGGGRRGRRRLQAISKPGPNLANPAKSTKARPKAIKEKGLDFLGFSWRN